MREYLTTERIESEKRLVVERVKDFGEIYEVFDKDDAATQSERCIQCGDPFCLNKCPLHNYIPQWLKSVAEKDLGFAFKLSNEPSPFPEVMGRVCPGMGCFHFWFDIHGLCNIRQDDRVRVASLDHGIQPQGGFSDRRRHASPWRSHLDRCRHRPHF